VNAALGTLVFQEQGQKQGCTWTQSLPGNSADKNACDEK